MTDPANGADDGAAEAPALDPTVAAEHHLVPLGTKLAKAFTLRGEGKHDDAAELLREILQADPRLAEPRLELAHIAAERQDWEEAEEQARAAVDILRAGGQWTASLSPEQMLAFAINLLGEVVYRALQDGDLIFRDAVAFTARWNEAAAFFEEAAKLDPSNEDARHWAIHVRPR